MNKSELNLLQARLNSLVGQALTDVSRMAEQNVLCLSFGPCHLDIQCYYRLEENGMILLAHNDYFQPSEAMWNKWRSEGYEEEEIPEDFQCQEAGANRMDERIEQLMGDLTDLTVRTVLVNSLGDVTLCLNSGAVLTMLVDTSGGEECWRYWRDGERQLVLYGDGVEIE